MDARSFFETIEKHFNSNLPFVVYREPGSSIIKCWLQLTDNQYVTETFTESGFVFAPFDSSEKSILFPKSECEFLELKAENLKEEMIVPTEIPNRENDRLQHLSLVAKGIEGIAEGNLQKVVLSRCESKPLQDLNPITIFKRLCSSYHHAMVYCWRHPKIGTWIGATPEVLFKVNGKRFTTMSLAGTRPYQINTTANWSAKEIDEQQIVTDFIIDQIRPYTNSIQKSEVETVRAGNLWHLKTEISCQINTKADLHSIIEALHPTPAVCGFPKAKSKDFILQHENYNRDFYTGFLGELNLKKTTSRNRNSRNVENNAYAVVKQQTSLYVNLRCMQLKDNTAHIYIGGGITKDSDPVKEWEETVNKAATINAVLS